MRNFKTDLFSKNYFRKLIGFAGIVLVNLLFISKPETAFGTLSVLALNSLMVYLVLEFSSFAGDAYISIDFRTDKEKKEDAINRKYEAFDGAIENLIIETAMGNISKLQLDSRLAALSEVKLFLNKEFPLALEAPKTEDNSFLEFPKSQSNEWNPSAKEEQFEVDISFIDKPIKIKK